MSQFCQHNFLGRQKQRAKCWHNRSKFSTLLATIAMLKITQQYRMVKNKAAPSKSLFHAVTWIIKKIDIL